MWPKVSVIWLNHNSMKIIDLVLKSLEAIADLDYPGDRYELIVVDNGSTDGSFERIREFLDKKSSLRKKIIRLEKNLGFTGGSNIGYRARDRESKYVLLVNNDAIPLQNSLKTLVEYAEKFDGVGGLNGVILDYDGKRIDTAGDFVDELLISYASGSKEVYPWIIRKPFYISYADGAYVLYSIEAIAKCIGEKIGDKMFVESFFAYGDDSIIGLQMWGCGYKQISIPHPVALHKRSSTFRRMSSLGPYLILRNGVTTVLLSNTRYKTYAMLYRIKSIVGRTAIRHGLPKTYLKAVYDGVKLKKRISMRYGISINLYKAPVIKLSHKDILRYYLFGTRETMIAFRKKILEQAIKAFEIND
ncbi:MAG: glycosyltransferase family 2 protein [Ignisphaera sp.]